MDAPEIRILVPWPQSMVIYRFYNGSERIDVLGMRKRMPLLHSRPLGGTTMGAREWMPCNADKGLSVAKCRGHFNVVQWIRESLAGE